MAIAVSSKSKSTSTASAAKGRGEELSEDDIRILAYQLYERRQADGADGDAASDWIEAERRLGTTSEEDTSKE